ncbi:N,N-dimethylformamidase beta subunit family domain-containing protein [Pseudonocardia asaccharolytica]|uniref:Large subunit of N,N-dimethylformamidase n=1 Tax=Pseudonocardia asaccharolytica DSM 44247 = NBRC 16224 TaxID=1123024 RepID=A0A511D997_9PSEU|nr:N,N-dimethylformamidase beta subunit family domain-containing protein [Pseudonocardia asaccharolytica]GEL20214.1 large subunit of N,N-dimethylformamidase [Pseudonocardia asaccharolytica DSM 44247 = NBRC 16224]
MTSLPVRVYTDFLSYEQGQIIQVQVSAEGPVDISLTRLINASVQDTSLDSEIPWINAGTYDASIQETCVGSFLLGEPSADAPAQSSTISFGAFVWSGNFASASTQTLVALGDGPTLQLVDGRPAIVSATSSAPVVIGPRLEDHHWHLVVASLGDDATITVAPVDGLRGAAGYVTAPWPGTTIQLTGAVTVGARNARRITQCENGVIGLAEDHFNGKVEDPFVTTAVIGQAEAEAIARGEVQIGDLQVVAGWDLSFRHGSDPVVAAAVAVGQPDGMLVNGPARGVTGRRFSGRHLDFNYAPSEYAAAHFHATDLLDAGWETALSAPLPDPLPSGVYGIVVSNALGSDTVPITVVPKETDPRNKVLVVLPTFTYLAYANEALFNGLDTSAMTDKEVTVEREDEAHVGDPSFGLSQYDTHPDGSGVITSSARRQIVNMRRGYRMWLVDAGRGFSSDMYLIEWLARRGIDADVVTDYEIHNRGPGYLASYAAIISGSHPEYTSEEMLDTLTEYRDNGGGLLYLGGNGWYWVTGVFSTAPLVVEIRRGHAGIRCWESLPGEVTLMSTGRPGGLWRHRGRAPQKLCGVGFAAQGWGSSAPYYRSEAAAAPEWEWVFDGVEVDPIGDYGEVMGGAAGDEIDRADRALGTPPHAVVLASSRGHSNFYQRVIEEIPMNLPEHGGGEQDPEVHADIVYFRTPGGGEVFSTGSIAWSGALLHNKTENGVSRMTENVIRAFMARRRT